MFLDSYINKSLPAFRKYSYIALLVGDNLSELIPLLLNK